VSGNVRTVVLVGNPNTGKSSVFNALTGASQHVGNWPGKTVEMRSGSFRRNGTEVGVIDLPGTYSLAALSPEEEITADVVLRRTADVVVTVTDASNLSRNLYLAVQIAESGIPQVVVLNMSDVAERRGLVVDVPGLSAALGVPVVRTVARRREGIEALRATLMEPRGASSPLLVDYGPEVEEELAALESQVRSYPEVAAALPARWGAVELLAGPSEGLAERLAPREGGPVLLVAAAAARERLEQHLGQNLDLLVAERRYRWIRSLVGRTVLQGNGRRPGAAGRLDRLVTHRILGLPIFLATMWVVFRITTDLAAAFLDWITELFSGPLSHWASSGLAAAGLAGTWVEGLVVDGLIGGLGAVLAFLPVLLSLYLALAVLEDSGYMARAAFVMHRVMRVVGLPGKAFLPMLVGFGCSVPAIYATRTLENRRDRLLTGLLVPFMSCGGRLPVYVLLASVFFSGGRGTVVFAMYLLGIAVAVAVGAVLARTVFSGEPVPFVMELPALRLPNLRTMGRLVRRRTVDFLRGAGTVILGASVVVWLLLAVPVGGGRFGQADIEDSAFAAAARTLSPALAPLGFGSWEPAGSLIGGLVAKEVIVSTLAEAYGLGGGGEPLPAAGVGEDLREIGRGFLRACREALAAIPRIVGVDVGGEPAGDGELSSAVRAGFEESSDGRGALAGLAFMVFVLLYAPCVATMAAMRKELGGGWVAVSLVGQTAVAWSVALLVYRGGRFLGLG
jgi:ferrous iron transport protein B